MDVIMPEKTGGEAYREICAMRGDMRVIFLSGYNADLVDMQRVQRDGAVTLIKPVRPEKLLSIMREMLNAPRVALPEVA